MNGFFDYDSLSDQFMEELKKSFEGSEDLQFMESLVMSAPSSVVDDYSIRKGGSRPGKARNVDRDIAGGAERIFNDYFSATPVYSDKVFRRRFRMQRALFLRIVDGIKEKDPFFNQKADALGRVGHSTLQKAVAAIRQLALGVSPDAVDEYVRMAASTADLCLEHFCRAVIDVFGEEYLRQPTHDDLRRILSESEARGFPGMLGSIDCYNWRWENCPKAWHGQHTGKKGTSIVLEAACTYDLWIWHAFFGLPGSLNDINVLQRSTLMHDLVNGTFPKYNFLVGEKEFSTPYWLADGIYPNWSVFVKTISEPVGEANKFFAMMQESTRKDIERGFGTLQKRFAIVRNPAKKCKDGKLSDIMTCCIILHNMIVENERHDRVMLYDVDYDHLSISDVQKIPNNKRRQSMANRIQKILEQRQNNPTVFRFELIEPNDAPATGIANTVVQANLANNAKELYNSDKHNELKIALVQHLWEKRGGR
jgi:Plant transposon protein